jgi:hypothetical protein
LLEHLPFAAFENKAVVEALQARGFADRDAPFELRMDPFTQGDAVLLTSPRFW